MNTAEKQDTPWAILGTTGLAVFAVFLDTTVLFVAFASISADYPSVGPAGMSWVLNAYTIVFAASLIPAGRLADRIGRKRTFLGAVVLFTVASMVCGLAPSVETLIAARVLQALGAAALVPSSLALVLQTFPRAKVPMAVAIWSAVGAVAGAVGPTLGALAVEHLSWRWAFYLNLPVGLVSFALGRRILPEGREAKPGPLPDPFSVALLIGSLGAMAYAFEEHGVGLDERTVSRRARRLGGGARALREPHPSRAEPALRLAAVRVAELPARERGDARLRARLLGDVPRERALPHARLGVLDLARGDDDLHRTAVGGDHGSVPRETRGAHRSARVAHSRWARVRCSCSSPRPRSRTG